MMNWIARHLDAKQIECRPIDKRPDGQRHAGVGKAAFICRLEPWVQVCANSNAIYVCLI